MSATRIQIPAELFALAESSRYQGKLNLPVLEAGPDDYRFAEPIAWEVEVTNTGAAFLVSGRAQGRGVCACSRCLEDVPHDFEGAIEGYYLIEGQADVQGFDDEDEPGEDEFEVLPADHIIDLEPLISAALIVDAPAMPLCRDDCLGLCPRCGTNLNDGPCDCGPDPDLAAFERESNPFAALAGLKFD